MLKKTLKNYLQAKLHGNVPITAYSTLKHQESFTRKDDTKYSYIVINFIEIIIFSIYSNTYNIIHVQPLHIHHVHKHTYIHTHTHIYICIHIHQKKMHQLRKIKTNNGKTRQTTLLLLLLLIIMQNLIVKRAEKNNNKR